MKGQDLAGLEIKRPHLVQTLATLLEGPTQAVVLEGPEGIGKSTLLRQFAETFPGRTAAIYLSGASRWAYDPYSVRLTITSALFELSRGRPMENDEAEDPHLLHKLFAELDRKARSAQMPYYVIVDGLEGLPQQEDDARAEILELLPFGYPSLRFLLSGDLAKLPLTDQARRVTKPFHVVYFTKGEAAAYLAVAGLTDTEVLEVYAATRGTPGYLASVLRRSHAATTREEVLKALPSAMKESFALEWKSATIGLGKTDILSLGVIAFGPRLYRVAELARLTGADPSGLKAVLGGLPFLSEVEEELKFVPEAMHHLAQQELEKVRTDVSELLIERLSAEPESDEALTHLTGLYSSSGHHQQIIDFLSPARFALLFQRAPSLSLVSLHAGQAITAAQALGRDSEVVRFTLQKCAIADIARGEGNLGEVRALAAIGDYEQAFAIAVAAPRADLRLRLLAAVGRMRKKQGLPIDDGLSQQINQAFEQVDIAALGPSLPEVASDLFPVFPDLATELVKKAGDSGGENALDWGLATLSIQAALEAEKTRDRTQASKLREHIRSPVARRISLAGEAMVGQLTAKEVIAEASRLEGTSDKLFILQRWMWSHRKREDAEEVLEFGLRTALTATGYSLTASTACELALCLPFLSHPHTVSFFVRQFDGLMSDIARIGPEEEVARLRLILARADWNHDRDAGRRRFEEMYDAIPRMKSPVARIGAAARFAAALKRSDPDRRLEAASALHAFADDLLETELRSILYASAEQLDVCKGAIRALSVVWPEKALAIVSSLNTEYRRDNGYRCFVEGAVAGPLSEISPERIGEALLLIVDQRVRDETVDVLLEIVAAKPAGPGELRTVRELCGFTSMVWDTSERARLAAVGLGVMARHLAEQEGKEEEAIERLSEQCRSAWRHIDDDWQRLRVGLQAIVTLAEHCPDEAAFFASEVNHLRRTLSLAGKEAEITACYSLRLAARAVAGLALRHDVSKEVAHLERAIEQLASVEDQARLIAELALRLWLANKREEAERIVQGRLRNTLQAVPEEDSPTRANLIIEVAPALYVGSRGFFESLMTTLPGPMRDEAVERTVRFVFQKVVPWDPYEGQEGMAFDVSFDEAHEVVRLINFMVTDGTIYGAIHELVDAVLDRKHLDRFKGSQRSSILQALQAVVTEKLPAPRFIQHEGYVVAAEAQLNRLREGNDRIPIKDLRARAVALPNVADRAFVLTVVGGAAASKKEALEALAEARAIADTIPSLADRVDHYRAIVSELNRHAPDKAKELLEETLRLAFGDEGDDDVVRRRRSLMELALRVAPDVANGVAAMTDDDPAKRRVEGQLRVDRLHNALMHRRAKEDDIKVNDTIEWCRACWRTLGSLLAGRTHAVPVERALGMLEIAGGQPLSVAYPVFAWFIETAIHRKRGAQASRDYIGPLFDACVLGAEVALRASGRASASRGVVEIDPSGSVIVRAGERDQALTVLREWLNELSPMELLVVEPYFPTAGVSLLAMIVDSCTEVELTVVAGRKESAGAGGQPSEEAYRNEWRRLRSDEPPPTRLVFVQGRQSKRCPFHDRWWLSKNGGITLGTSYNGLGVRLSEVTRISESSARAKFDEVAGFAALRTKEHHGERLEYTVFEL